MFSSEAREERRNLEVSSRERGRSCGAMEERRARPRRKSIFQPSVKIRSQARAST